MGVRPDPNDPGLCAPLLGPTAPRGRGDRRASRQVSWRAGARRLLIVSGKGGVGKSTVAAAAGVAAARAGLRTIVAELAGRHDVAALLGAQAGEGMREVEIYRGLHHVTIEREPALEEYLRNEVPGPLPAAMLARSRAFDLFIEAAPGMGELLSVGKLWELTQRPRHARGAREYDLVVLDGPASGQLIGLLQAPHTFGSMVRGGPVARQGAAIDEVLFDPAQTELLAVAAAEQMAVSETLALQAELRERFHVELRAVVVNRMVPARFTSHEAAALRAAPDHPAVRSALWLYGRAEAQHTQLRRLRDEIGAVATSTLPFLFGADFGRAQVEQLAELLEHS